MASHEIVSGRSTESWHSALWLVDSELFLLLFLDRASFLAPTAGQFGRQAVTVRVEHTTGESVPMAMINSWEDGPLVCAGFTAPALQGVDSVITGLAITSSVYGIDYACSGPVLGRSRRARDIPGS